MTQEAALLVMIGAAVLILGLIAFGWWRRTRRDRGLTAPVGELAADATTLGVFPALYVATTRHGEPLERLAIRGLGFRSRADVTVTTAGVALDLTGRPRVVIGRDAIVEVAQATVAIDRVVERDGLVRLTWRIDPATTVDSYLRPQDASARALSDAIGALTTSTGSDA
ncbi:hypothetical protein [Microbacterium terricola]|uniref:PH domain-containing protein n=1 Tax=Microbacterium terricola TaxID=344163 RepID=A0ABM8DY49_9MICO|nr:hypothetical protein [Microbacterium terricola]UYK38733.1 hypothetical protein OAU46_08400 [Microbacterium terricola]BDV30577.1 hypothetical protein Microterr_12370 [Microbacterium terricola]